MSVETPLHNGELLCADELSGQTWEVVSKHHGHTMRVEGRVHRQRGSGAFYPSGVFVVSCSCGERFRILEVTIAKRVATEAS